MTDDIWLQKLLTLENQNAPLRQRYEQSLWQARQDRAGSGGLWWHAVLSIVGAVGGLAVAHLALTEPAGTPAVTRVVLLVLAAFPMSWSILFGTAYVRRWPRTGPQRSIAAGMALACTLLTALLCAGLIAVNGESPVGFSLLVVTCLQVLVAAVLVINNRIRQAEVRLRLDLLSCELRLAQLGEGNFADSAKEGPHRGP